MTLVSSLLLHTIWSETTGTDAVRAKQLVDLAKTRGVPSNDLALERVVDLVARKQFGRVAAMFADTPSSTRPHDVTTQGMRAGAFASDARESPSGSQRRPRRLSRARPHGRGGGSRAARRLH